MPQKKSSNSSDAKALIRDTASLLDSPFGHQLTYIPCKSEPDTTKKRPIANKQNQRTDLTWEQLKRYYNQSVEMIGVLLEKKIIVFDVDSISAQKLQEWLVDYFQLTPLELETFFTTAYYVSSGQKDRCSYWFSLTTFPLERLDKLRYQAIRIGDGTLEIRCGKHYQIISGTHPNGTIYENGGPIKNIQALPTKIFNKLVNPFDTLQNQESDAKNTNQNENNNVSQNKSDQSKTGDDKDSIEELSLELQRIHFTHEILTAPSVEDRNDWMRLTYAIRVKAQSLSPNLDDEWAYQNWVEWSKKADNTCSSDYEFRKNWDSFEPGGSIQPGTFHKYFSQQEYNIEAWNSPTANTKKISDKARHSQNQLKHKYSYLLNSYLTPNELAFIDMQFIVYVSDGDDRPYYDITTRTRRRERELIKLFKMKEKQFFEYIKKHVPKVAGIKFRPGETIIFQDGRYDYVNSYKSRPDYAHRPDSLVMAMFFKLAFRILDTPSFILFMNEHAYKLANPGGKIRHTLVIFSPTQGIGKSTILNPFTDYWKNYSLVAQATDFLGQYNDRLDGIQYIAMNDPDLVSVKQKRLFAQKMKTLIAPATQTLTIHRRYHDDYEGFNCFFMVITCNNINDLHIIDGDRRYAVVKALDLPPLPDAFFEEYNKLYSVVEPEEYIDKRSIAQIKQIDANPNGVKDIIGAFHRWDYTNPEQSYKQLLEQLEPYGVKPNPDEDPYSPDIFLPFQPSAPPVKTEAFYDMADAGIDPFLQSILEMHGDQDFIFDSQIVDLFNESLSQLNPQLPFEVRDKTKRRAVMSEGGYFKFDFFYGSSSGRSRIVFYSKLACKVRSGTKRGLMGTAEEREYNTDAAKKAYKNLILQN